MAPAGAGEDVVRHVLRAGMRCPEAGAMRSKTHFLVRAGGVTSISPPR